MIITKSLRNYAWVALTLATGSQAAIIPRADPPPTSDAIPVKDLGSLAMSKPGFASVVEQDGDLSLFVSTFRAFGSDSVYRINDIANAPSAGMDQMQADQIGGSITWPNDITEAPREVFGTGGVVVGGGFLVPGKSNGALYFSPSSGGDSGDWVRLYGKSGWFYHRALFADVDKDGELEMVSCRAKKPTFGGTETMLVYLKPEDRSQPAGPWTEVELGAGCDSLFTVADLNGDGLVEVIAPSFFTSTLNVFYSNAKTGFANPSDVNKVVMDSKVGAAFDVQVVDVNNDGKDDLIVSNHQSDGSGAVFAYEIPSDITNASGYVRHTLAQGFPVTQGGLNQASPGSAIAFYPTRNTANGAPYIALAGDAAQIAYVLIPGKSAWTYSTTTLYNCGCTVGKLAVADVDGDGSQEIFVPCYDNGELAAFSFGA